MWRLGRCGAVVYGIPDRVAGIGKPDLGGALSRLGGSVADHEVPILEPLAIYPATYIWRAYPIRQAGYYTAFFLG
jgi:hypothetical protein